VAKMRTTILPRSAVCVITRARYSTLRPRLAAAQATNIGTATSVRVHMDRHGTAARTHANKTHTDKLRV
jgi:hypothetical protein